MNEPTTSQPPTPQPPTTCALCGGNGSYHVARLLTRKGEIIEDAWLVCGECDGTGQTQLPL